MPALGDAGPNAGLCKTYSVLLCVLKQPRVVDSSTEPFKRGVKLRARDPIVLRPVLKILVILPRKVNDRVYVY